MLHLCALSRPSDLHKHRDLSCPTSRTVLANCTCPAPFPESVPSVESFECGNSLAHDTVKILRLTGKLRVQLLNQLVRCKVDRPLHPEEEEEEEEEEERKREREKERKRGRKREREKERKRDRKT